MASKEIELPGIGRVLLTKRKGAKSLRVTFNSDDTIRVTLPPWVPYQAGISFAIAKQEWIQQHRIPQKIFSNGALIGKAHRLHLEAKAGVTTIRARVLPNEVRVTHPLNEAYHAPSVQVA